MRWGHMRMLSVRCACLHAMPVLVLLAGCALPIGVHFPARVPPQPTATATAPSLVWHQATLPEGFIAPGGPEGRNNGFAISPADGQRAWACIPVATSPGTFILWATRDTAATWQKVSTLAPQAPTTPQSCLLIAD